MEKPCPVFLYEKDMAERFHTDLSPSFAALKASKMTIPSWGSFTFWDNMLSKQFAEKYVTMLIESILQETRSKNSSGDSNETIISCVLSLFSAYISYGVKAPTEVWNAVYNKLINSGNLAITHSFLYIQNLMLLPEFNFRAVLDSITMSHEYPIIAASIQLLNFMLIISKIRSDSTHIKQLLSAFSVKLGGATDAEAIILLHILKTTIILFPGLSKENADIVIPFLQDLVCRPAPVCNDAISLGQLITREIEYPGAAFFSSIKEICESVVPDDSAVNIIFGSEFTQFSSYLITRAPTGLSIDNALFNFGNFFIRSKFNNKARNAKHVFKMLQMLEFTDEGMERIIKKLKITPHSSIVDFDRSNVIFPTAPLTQVKLTSSFDLDPELTIKISNGINMFVSPNIQTVSNATVRPISQYLDLHSVKSVKQKIIIAGNDFTLNNFLLSLITGISRNSNVACYTLFTIFLYPLGDSGPNEMADYLAAIDPIYCRFVRGVFEASSMTAPTQDDSVTVAFPAIIGPACEESVWFGNPSPNGSVQFSIHHFISFANKFIEANIWCAYLILGEKTVSVPFICSLQIGPQFGSVDEELRTWPSAIATSDEKTPTLLTFTSLSIWNTSSERNVSPEDNYLLLETVCDERPSLSAEECEGRTRRPIHSLSLRSRGGEFRIVVDGRAISGVRAFQVGPLNGIDEESSTQAKIRFATFVHM